MRNIFESAKKVLFESPEGIQKGKEDKEALMKVAKALNMTALDASIVLNDLKKVNTPSAEFIRKLVHIVATNPSVAKKAVNEENLQEAIPADQVTYFNLVRSIKKTGTSNPANTKFVSGFYVLVLEKKDGFFGSISKIDEKRKVLWTVSLEPVKELNDAPKLVFKGITREEFIKLKNVNLNEEIVELTIEEEAMLLEDRLQNDIKSLKRIGWKLDKVIKFMVTKGEDYGVKMTADLITMYYNDGGAKKKDSTPMWPPVASKSAPKVKKPKWPNDPPKSKRDDAGHAENYLAQAIASDESPDMEGTEAWQLLSNAGYTERAKLAVIKNMGWDDAQFMRTYDRYLKGKG